jgi:NADPH-dependent 2,4-dienoyl-CoA reductase/sulfur reductase-like enzyme
MPASDTFVIAGGGLAGAKAAEALRTQGVDGRIVLAAEEDIRPYERPPLSKEYLQGKAGTRSSCTLGLIPRQPRRAAVRSGSGLRLKGRHEIACRYQRVSTGSRPPRQTAELRGRRKPTPMSASGVTAAR